MHCPTGSKCCKKAFLRRFCDKNEKNRKNSQKNLQKYCWNTKNLLAKVKIWGILRNITTSECSSVGRASRCQRDCRRFESGHSLHFFALKVPKWRNGRRARLKIWFPLGVWVQVPPSVPTVINYRYLVIERQKLQKKAEKERFFCNKVKKMAWKIQFWMVSYNIC